MDYNNLLFEKRDGIGYLTLNRPDKLNALSPALMAELRHALDTIEEGRSTMRKKGRKILFDRFRENRVVRKEIL